MGKLSTNWGYVGATTAFQALQRFAEMTVYYNENDPKAAEWLRELIKAHAITPGDVDERSIEDVTPNDLRGYKQCHFFAGIGGWAYALQLAGWPSDRPVWTGSCPCQPFSQAGQGARLADERHLWPFFFHLIEVCHPPIVFGEQVASPAGMQWFDLVSSDLEGTGYAVGASDLCAAGVGAPHVRQRLYWVADANGRNASSEGLQRSGKYRLEPQDCEAVGMAESQGQQSHWDRYSRLWWGKSSDGSILCTDGRRRPVEPGTFPLAHGIPGRVGLLRGYGNAIVPRLAAKFIQAYCEVT